MQVSSSIIGYILQGSEEHVAQGIWIMADTEAMEVLLETIYPNMIMNKTLSFLPKANFLCNYEVKRITLRLSRVLNKYHPGKIG